MYLTVSPSGNVTLRLKPPSTATNSTSAASSTSVVPLITCLELSNVPAHHVLPAVTSSASLYFLPATGVTCVHSFAGSSEEDGAGSLDFGCSDCCELAGFLVLQPNHQSGGV